MELHDKFARALAEFGAERQHLLLGLSGGVDSTALALICTEYGPWPNLSAVHVNHHLRDAESDEDEAFVRNLCTRLGIPFQVLDGTLAQDRVRDLGIEAAAREIRYRLFRETRDRTGAALIATAHHANDQAETILMRMITGTRIESLRGIAPRTSDGVIRPLLQVTRRELEEYVHSRGIEAREDHTNRDRRFLRNRVRHDVLPPLLELNPNLVSSLGELARQARAMTAIAQTIVGQALGTSVETTADGSRIDAGELRRTFAPHPHIHDELLEMLLLHEIRRLTPSGRGQSSDDIHRIVRELDTTSRLSLSEHLELLREGDNLILRRRSRVAPPEFDLPLKLGGVAEMHAFAVHLRPASDDQPLGGGTRARISVHPGAHEFRVRTRRRGDRFHPLGMSGARNLADFLTSRKVPRRLRDRLPLLTVDGEIAWVAGVEVAEPFRVGPADRTVVEVLIEYRT